MNATLPGRRPRQLQRITRLHCGEGWRRLDRRDRDRSVHSQVVAYGEAWRVDRNQGTAGDRLIEDNVFLSNRWERASEEQSQSAAGGRNGAGDIVERVRRRQPLVQLSHNDS